MRLIRLAALLAVFVATASPAIADATVFIGGNTTPSSRQVKGFAFGTGLLIVGFEFEYANTSEDRSEAAPSLEHDIDTPDDLAALARALDGARTVAPRTRGALRQLQRSGAIRDAADLVRV